MLGEIRICSHLSPVFVSGEKKLNNRNHNFLENSSTSLRQKVSYLVKDSIMHKTYVTDVGGN